MNLLRSLILTMVLLPAAAWVNAGLTFSGNVPQSEEFIHGIITAAQITFERGTELYRAGDVQTARKLFEQSHHLLLEADEMGDDNLKRRIDRVFEMFYREIAAVDSQTAELYRTIGGQIQQSYDDAPVYAGQVKYHIDYLTTNKRSFLENSFARSYRYLPMIRKEFVAAGIPEDLAYMALIESGFRPDPTSHAGARGLWQFMPVTAARFGLQIGDGIDERTDPLKSTRAAAAYLKILYNQFGNWPLAVAAYNCGEGRVGNALKAQNATTYWELIENNALPIETQRFVPSIIAVTLIAREPATYGIRVD